MRLKNYILESTDGRGKSISEKQALKMLPKFSDAISVIRNGGITISRIIRSKSIDYYYVDPSKSGPRRSVNTYNYYTLIMDNSKRWSKYPKRSKSLICSATKTETLKYLTDSDEYLVLPKNKTKIGQCQSDDLWFSFPDIGTDMNQFAISLNYVLNYPDFTDEELEKPTWWLKGDKKDYDKSYSMYLKACKRFDDWVKNTTELTPLEIKKIYRAIWLESWNGREPLAKYIDKILDPNKNDFELKSIINLTKENVELWFDKEALLINGPVIEKFLRKVL